jgi:hypothetical protein
LLGTVAEGLVNLLWNVSERVLHACSVFIVSMRGKLEQTGLARRL